MIEIIVLNVIWLAVLVFQDRENKKERMKLVDRIMAKSLGEVKQIEEPFEPVEPEVEEEFIPIEDASDEEFSRAIRKQLGRETMKDKVKDKIRKATKRRK